MFSQAVKQQISEALQNILRATNDSELPPPGREIRFTLHVFGRRMTSSATIHDRMTTHVRYPATSKFPLSDPIWEWPEREVAR